MLFTVLLSGFALFILGGFLSYSIGNGLFQTRLQQVLSESSRSIGQLQKLIKNEQTKNQELKVYVDKHNFRYKKFTF